MFSKERSEHDGGGQLLRLLQHTPLLLVQRPHQPAQLPHLGAINAMHCAGLHDALEPLRGPRAGAGAAVHPADILDAAHRRWLRVWGWLCGRQLA
jgi:hypothetical protein